MLPIYVVNNYGQFNHLILRMLRDLEIDAKMVPNDTSPHDIADQCRGIILGGGPSLERSGKAPEYLELDIPMLGICLGLHIIAVRRGGEVSTGQKGGYGAVEVEIQDHDDILAGYGDRISVWASHADEVSAVPDGFGVLASSPICGVEAMASPEERIYGIQWHPEVSHTENGRLLFENFDRLCAP